MKNAGTNRKPRTVALPRRPGLSARVNSLFKAERWGEARTLLERALADSPHSHWLLARLAATYHEQRDYQTALRIKRRAARIAPNCPLVLYGLAATLESMGRHREALTVYSRLLERGLDRIAYGRCGEGWKWAYSLLNDCRYRVSAIYARWGEHGRALRWARLHRRLRRAGIPSDHRADEVSRHIRVLKLLCYDGKRRARSNCAAVHALR